MTRTTARLPSPEMTGAPLAFFADKAVNGLGADGLFFGGGASLLVDQLVAVGATLVWSFGLSYAIAKIIDVTLGLRVPGEDEQIGLDQSQHAESAYSV